MYGGKQKFPLRSLKQSTFKLFLGWAISGNLNVRLNIKLATQVFISDSNISDNNTIYSTDCLVYSVVYILSS